MGNSFVRVLTAEYRWDSTQIRGAFNDISDVNKGRYGTNLNHEEVEKNWLDISLNCDSSATVDAFVEIA